MGATRHLLVDGYNILHAWGWLDARAEVVVAREKLAGALAPIRDVEDVRVTLVFDGRGAAAAADAAHEAEDFQVVYAPAGLTADGAIERLVAGSPDPAACAVATADGLERETVLAAGGTCVSPEELRAWIERCNHRAASARRRSAARTGFSNKLPL